MNTGNCSQAFELTSFTRTAVALLAAVSLSLGIQAQNAIPDTGRTLATAAIIPQQVQFNGKLPTRIGDTVEAQFRIYAAPEGGEPLWTEIQHITVGEDGSYSVLLGSATSAGLPQTVFAGGAARWLGVSVERGEEGNRVLLSSVPYAMKSADAESLSGHAATEFVTQTQLAQFIESLAAATQLSQPSEPRLLPPGATPLTNQTLTGSGTTGMIPLWNGTYSQGNSVLSQVGTSIGINKSAPSATLDVNGTADIEGYLTVEPIAPATTSAAQQSQHFNLAASAWSTVSKGSSLQVFDWVVVPSGNNTSSPSGSLYLQFQSGAGTRNNILHVSSTGVISFASGQTFPGVISSVSANSPVTSSTTNGAVSVGLNESTLVSDITPAIANNLTSTYAQLGAANVFTQGQQIEGPSSVGGTNNSGGAEFVVTNNGDSTSSAISASNSGEYGTGVAATASYGGEAIQAYGQQSAGSIGVFGGLANSNGNSNSFYLLNSNDGLNAGVWADGPDGQQSALTATADNLSAGIFYNDSATSTTILALNNNSGGSTGLVVPAISNVIRAGGPGGFCGINQSGSLSCTGQMKAIVPTKDGARQLETYSVQSAENWVEDYGSGQLIHGSAVISVEPAFAETVNTGVEFHVFLTPGGDCKGLYVSNKTANSFEVHELGGGTSDISFDYKIVAKRSGLEAQRLADVTDRMRIESDRVALKPLDHPLPKAQMLHPHSPAQSVRAKQTSR